MPFLVSSGAEKIEKVFESDTFVTMLIWNGLQVEPSFDGFTEELKFFILSSSGPIKHGCLQDDNWLIKQKCLESFCKSCYGVIRRRHD